jgi:hypothetical protein
MELMPLKKHLPGAQESDSARPSTGTGRRQPAPNSERSPSPALHPISSKDMWPSERVIRLQAMAGNEAVAGLLMQRQHATAPAKPARPASPKPSPPESHAFPWVGRIQTRYNAALRRDPSKDPDAPYANIEADLPEGTLVEVSAIKKGWLKVEVIDPPGGRPQHGYVSHELVRFVRDGAWEIEMPADPPLVFSVTEAFLVLKRAEMRRASDSRYAPDDDEGHRIAVATRALEDTGRYQVDRSTFRVTFVGKPGTKIKIESIEDFVLFAETVEHVYSSATPKEVASEIRQVWFAGENWETLVASRGIDNVNIEDPADPIGAMFDMVDLHSKGSQKVIKTRIGDVAISHVMAGIDATLSGMAPEPGRAHPKLRAAWEMVNAATGGDVRDFMTWSGDIGQAYGEYILERYHNDVTSKGLKDYVTDKASPEQFLADIHGYIATKVWRKTPTSIDPGGGTMTISGILRTTYMVDKAGSPAEATYQAYLEELTGQSGAALRNMVAQRSLAFARIWYVKNLATLRSGHYADQFDEHHNENEKSAAAADKLGDVVDSFMKMLATKVK